MHRSELERTIPCASCGAAISEEARSFAFGENDLLCWECAIRRGGSYDEGEDRWITPPSTSDLPAEEE